MKIYVLYHNHNTYPQGSLQAKAAAEFETEEEGQAWLVSMKSQYDSMRDDPSPPLNHNYWTRHIK